MPDDEFIEKRHSALPAGLHFAFQPTFTLGTVVHVVVLAVVLIVGWTKINDRIDQHDKDIKVEQEMQDKEQTIVQELQLEQVRTAAILSATEERIARDENKSAH